jgi:hypothetical protein
MQTTTLVTMIVIMGIVWGGFATLLTIALRSEREKRGEQE